MQVPSVGPPPLLFIVQTALKALTPLLGDIGCVPVELVWAALAAADPEELAAIEDATLEGVACRDIRPATWPLWWRHCTAGSLPSLTQLPQALPPLAAPSSAPPAAEPRGVAPADWRVVYGGLARQLEERRARLGHRLKQQREAEQQRKASRSIQVIAPLDRRRGRGGGGGGGRAAGKLQKLSGVKERLLKKLNMAPAAAGPRPPRAGPIRPPPPPRPLPTRSALAGVPRSPAAAAQGGKNKEKKALGAVQWEEDDIFAGKKGRR